MDATMAMNHWFYAHLWLSIPLALIGTYAGFAIFGPVMLGWQLLAKKYCSEGDWPENIFVDQFEICRLYLWRWRYTVRMSADADFLYLETNWPFHPPLAIPWIDVTIKPEPHPTIFTRGHLRFEQTKPIVSASIKYSALKRLLSMRKPETSRKIN
jgi:hypothetical protein